MAIPFEGGSSRRDFLKALGLGGAVLTTGAIGQLMAPPAEGEIMLPVAREVEVLPVNVDRLPDRFSPLDGFDLGADWLIESVSINMGSDADFYNSLDYDWMAHGAPMVRRITADIRAHYIGSRGLTVRYGGEGWRK